MRRLATSHTPYNKIIVALKDIKVSLRGPFSSFIGEKVSGFEPKPLILCTFEGFVSQSQENAPVLLLIPRDDFQL